MEYAYYPGCSLEATNPSYDMSFQELAKPLGYKLNEIEDWNCCGATAYMSIDDVTSYAFSARNLAIAEKMNMDIVVPCSACYSTLNKTNKYFNESPEVKKRVSDALASANLSYKGNVKVRHAVDVIFNDVGLDKIKDAVKNPLEGLKVACYYGCQVVRPIETLDDVNKPVILDKMVDAVGAECVDYPLKTFCCGGSNMITSEELGHTLVRQILKAADDAGADIIITTCPLCQINVEGHQDKVSHHFGKEIKIPVLFFTQLLGLAYGISRRKLGLHKHIVSPDKVLSKFYKGVAA